MARTVSRIAGLIGLAILAATAPARAADPGGPADSLPDLSAGEAAAAPRSRPAGFDPGLDRRRVELGAGVVRGYFDAVGSVGYRRFLRERRGWAQFLVGELSGSKKGYLTEGVMSAYYFFRHRRAWHPEWRVRPILEAGPGVHLAVQSARLTGFSEQPFHAKAFLKAHGYAGVEALLSPKVGILVRGRLSIPEYHPLDYAQAAIFLR